MIQDQRTCAFQKTPGQFVGGKIDTPFNHEIIGELRDNILAAFPSSVFRFHRESEQAAVAQQRNPVIRE
ncbi:Uncharacterised protein [Serratia plymuthica]|uniref:Uncharacterized protein n=1 Tax=Serratia plymuthica TaxID=82996 RepID=A0A2X4V5M6_SERPL|nr:Uncharacterised protein [Serratia plymuthica]